ncbi:hypothetical protein CH254_04755 [Rhodococcus sp. 06-412-2C]|uniref:hypothetical protein n=1 Tax=unclassified Rhodococcus (in: high G+C Gram-positive bacteria) TaxID=192944 RepID=UPI000B9A3DE9|nr:MULTISPECIES: hypothetical protein [unclassified Rhodococcus (in: high G+C Gram-positive bacteria)]OZC91791.1 hypothetical protein CH254_04755 [Rhodococcus sp. 06-412-2C]OZC92359.1 hypothetical protein CH279_26030 [Rhodococcus sp. 06-412-2B]
MKKITAAAYEALREALPSLTWNKRAFKSFVRTALRDHPELLAGLDFDLPKREVGDALVTRMAANEAKYQQATLTLMVEIADMQHFPNIEQMKDAADRDLRRTQAQTAVANLSSLLGAYRQDVNARNRIDVDRAAREAAAAETAHFQTTISDLLVRYLMLDASSDPQERGRQFEVLLTDTFLLFDMEPRLAFSFENEQIDGSLSFDTDDYIVEAKWLAKPASRADLDVFAKKVERKGRNAQGIFISRLGLSAPALAEYSSASPFIAFNGDDLYLVYDQSVRLDDLLRMKKRHLNETGSCLLSARDFLAGP